MPLVAESLQAKIIANFGSLGGDSAEAQAQFQEGVQQLAEAVAKAVVDTLTTEAQVFIPSGAVVTAGSPTTQSNPAPVLGMIK